jgi:hypothetical protein
MSGGPVSGRAPARAPDSGRARYAGEYRSS